MFLKECFSKLGHFFSDTLARGGRPATTTSRPIHNLLIFSSEPPRNPRPSNIIIVQCQIFEDKTIFLKFGHIRK